MNNLRPAEKWLRQNLFFLEMTAKTWRKYTISADGRKGVGSTRRQGFMTYYCISFYGKNETEKRKETESLFIQLMHVHYS